MAVAWNHLQVELIDRLGDEGLALARQLAMTTYRSEADFDERFGRDVEPDGRPSIVSYLDHQGRKLVDRFDRDDVPRPGRRDGPPRHRPRPRRPRRRASPRSRPPASRLTGLGIQDDILYGPRQVRALVEAARRPASRPRYREIRSTKGHDAFLVEWDQLARVLGDALADARLRRARRGDGEDEEVVVGAA